jgi:outer membrane lipoprotein-sorting protein
MRKRSLVFCVMGLGLLWSAASAPADTIESVEKAITASSKKIKSLTADMRTVMDIDTKEYESKSTSEGRFEMLRKDGKVFTRVEMKVTSTTKIGGKTEKQESTTLMITDGEYAYSYTEAAATKAAYKMKCPTDWDQDPFEPLRKTNDLELLPDEKIDGVEVYVVQATPKKSAKDAAPGKTVQYYRKDCGFPAKVVMFDAAGKPMTATTYSGVKLDATISPDRFVFKAPAGVEVVDMTKMAQPGEKAGARKGEASKKEGENAGAGKGEEPKKPAPKLPKLPKRP